MDFPKPNRAIIVSFRRAAAHRLALNNLVPQRAAPPNAHPAGGSNDSVADRSSRSSRTSPRYFTCDSLPMGGGRQVGPSRDSWPWYIRMARGGSRCLSRFGSAWWPAQCGRRRENRVRGPRFDSKTSSLCVCAISGSTTTRRNPPLPPPKIEVWNQGSLPPAREG